MITLNFKSYPFNEIYLKRIKKILDEKPLVLNEQRLNLIIAWTMLGVVFGILFIICGVFTQGDIFLKNFMTISGIVTTIFTIILCKLKWKKILLFSDEITVGTKLTLNKDDCKFLIDKNNKLFLIYNKHKKEYRILIGHMLIDMVVLLDDLNYIIEPKLKNF